ncbi:uncharacterized protein SOCE26_009990 [Sorangium cellulosum]|uniref:DUF6688 domain-containing protein n=1 Tax=Sorangium cellulosum TaxID=56 RepID=A0A2L0EJY1_SORCE|nr:DUF6688 family protein [Sorangium cellulosum]AUX39605.1 uncharacterized protein SOCE26_009990 [Sorangium cellulosum]
MAQNEARGGKVGDFGIALVLTVGYGSPVVLGALFALANLGPFPSDTALVIVPLGIVACSALARWLYRAVRRRGRAPFQIAAEVLALLVLPAWGLAYSHTAEAKCVVGQCSEGVTPLRPLAEPEVFGLLALHALTALAYAVSRRRPAALDAPAELLVHAGLLVGIAAHALLAVHFGGWVAAGILFPPLFAPCLAPVITLVFYGVELRARLRRRGLEARLRALAQAPESAYRESPPQEPLPPDPHIHGPTLARALALSPLLLGAYAVAHAVWLGHAGGALQVFTRTCNYTLSRVPLEIVPESCHYLCTVAARGHGWLVRPLRLGRRRGVPILVNRQLAVANAFEDLLHERWPRFGRAARRLYDRLGLPVSRYIRGRWLADLIYLAMKPCEWLLYLALVLLDPGPPEARIDRMYR